MKVKVNEQIQLFYLAYEKWTAAAGHEIKVGKYRFCAIPTRECINVSEVTTGSNVFEIPMSLEIMLATIEQDCVIGEVLL